MNVTTNDTARRDAWIVRQFRAGRTITEIGLDVSLTKMRVSQIVKRAGVPRREGGRSRSSRLFATRPTVARGVTLTPFADRLLQAAAARAGVGVSHVVDYAVRLHAGSLTDKDFAE